MECLFPENATLINVGGAYSSLLLGVSFIINPLIQFWRSGDYRKEMRRVLLKWKANNAVAPVMELNKFNGRS